MNKQFKNILRKFIPAINRSPLRAMIVNATFFLKKLVPRSNTYKDHVIALSLGIQGSSFMSVRAAHSKGFKVVLFAQNPEIMESLYVDVWHRICPIERSEECIRIASSYLPKACLIGSKNVLTEAQSKICQEFGLRGPSELAVETTNDKLVFRTAQLQAGLKCLDVVEFSIDDLEPIKNIDFPFIIKPAMGTASKGVTVVRSEQDVQDYVIGFKKYEDDISIGENLIAEQMINGDQFDVEGVVSDGEVLVFAYVKEVYGTHSGSRFAPRSFLFNPPIKQEQRQLLADYVTKVVLASGLRNGAFTCELRIAPNGQPYAIDYAARMGYEGLVSESAEASFSDCYVGVLCGEGFEKYKDISIKSKSLLALYLFSDEEVKTWKEFCKKYPENVSRQRLEKFFWSDFPAYHGYLTVSFDSYEELYSVISKENILHDSRILPHPKDYSFNSY